MSRVASSSFALSSSSTLDQRSALASSVRFPAHTDLPLAHRALAMLLAVFLAFTSEA